jgi:hypothetical protein
MTKREVAVELYQQIFEVLESSPHCPLKFTRNVQKSLITTAFLLAGLSKADAEEAFDIQKENEKSMEAFAIHNVLTSIEQATRSQKQ